MRSVKSCGTDRSYAIASQLCPQLFRLRDGPRPESARVPQFFTKDQMIVSLLQLMGFGRSKSIQSRADSDSGEANTSRYRPATRRGWEWPCGEQKSVAHSQSRARAGCTIEETRSEDQAR